MRMIRKTSKIVRTSEKVRLRKKQEWLESKVNECEHHYICSWLRELKQDMECKVTEISTCKMLMSFILMRET